MMRGFVVPGARRLVWAGSGGTISFLSGTGQRMMLSYPEIPMAVGSADFWLAALPCEAASPTAKALAALARFLLATPNINANVVMRTAGTPTSASLTEARTPLFWLSRVGPGVRESFHAMMKAQSASRAAAHRFHWSWRS